MRYLLDMMQSPQRRSKCFNHKTLLVTQILSFIVHNMVRDKKVQKLEDSVQVTVPWIFCVCKSDDDVPCCSRAL